MSNHRALLAPLAATALVVALAGCTANPRTTNAAAGGTGQIAVAASDTSCTLSRSALTSGTTSFVVTNQGSSATEFELLAKDGLTIVGEVENVGPGLSRTLSLQAQPGTYTALCKPGMVGNGVGRSTVTVTGKQMQLAGDVQTQTKRAAAQYEAYVRDQSSTLLAETKRFAALYRTGDATAAKALYPEARAYYERIEPVAESFGDLDPDLDERQGDVKAGTEWTGWHRIEKDLWQPTPARNGGSAYRALSGAARAALADKLVADTTTLNEKVHSSSFTVTADTISNGAIGLLDEVASSKITGEEENWSHTDLWDFKANVQGAEVAYAGVRDLAKAEDPSVVSQIDTRFAALDSLLAKYGSLQKGFALYDKLSKSDVKTLSDSVNALGEPLSKLTAAVLK